jgi:hypothetical protein
MKAKSTRHIATLISKVPDPKIKVSAVDIAKIIKYICALEALDRYVEILQYEGTAFADVHEPALVMKSLDLEVRTQLQQMIKTGKNNRYTVRFRNIPRYKRAAKTLCTPYIKTLKAKKVQAKIEAIVKPDFAPKEKT